ncbi:hypothetical protein ACEQ8H_000872 [Pleosporales sp. CAS-2024a]
MSDSSTLRTCYPEGELSPAPLATPLSGPRVISPDNDREKFQEGGSGSSLHRVPSSASQRLKRESYNLSGSVFLITGKGQTLNLPAPSESPADPLGWALWKRGGAFLAIVWFAAVALAITQATGLFIKEITHDLKIDAFIMVIDMTFIHERPRAIAILWSIAGFFGTVLVATVPYISDHGVLWRLYYRYCSVLAVGSIALTFFLFPETYFKRPTVAFDGLIVLQSATEKLTVFKDIEIDSNIYRDLPELPRMEGILGRFSFSRSPFASWKAMIRCYPQMAFCAVNPLIFCMAIAVSINYANMLFIGTTYSRVLVKAPYHLPSDMTNLISIASGVGGIMALPAVYLVQKVLDHLAKRNHGVREAEHYLVELILPVISGAASSLLYGLAAHYRLPLATHLLAYGLNGFSWVTIAIGSTMWVTEAFPRWAAPALAAMSGVSCLVSFGFCFALEPWVNALGYKIVGIEFAVFQIFTGLVVVPIAFWGKSARQVIHGRWSNERSGALRPL